MLGQFIPYIGDIGEVTRKPGRCHNQVISLEDSDQNCMKHLQDLIKIPYSRPVCTVRACALTPINLLELYTKCRFRCELLELLFVIGFYSRLTSSSTREFLRLLYACPRKSA